MYEARIRESLPDVQERIETACVRAGRGNDVRIIAVTKGHPVEAVRAAVACGLKDCGENRVPELAEKVETLGRDAAHWHLIGHLQRNKVKAATPLFDMVHSIDSLRLARELSNAAGAAGLTIRGLVQVNASGEDSKSGIDVSSAETDNAVEVVQQIAALPGIEVHGLMTMAPFVDDEAVLRTTFARTRALLDACVGAQTKLHARHLSMGMSNDFEIAVEEGSTLVRLGTILFGERGRI
jgi:pyridoxal phosphate enzyme (YggS family)